MKRAYVHVALVAMLLRALLPVGWMPGTTASGAMALVICSGDGPALFMPGMAGMDHKSKPGTNHHNEECPFAAAPHYAPPASLAVLASTILAPAAIQSRTIRSLAVAGTRHTPQAPRAPPALA